MGLFSGGGSDREFWNRIEKFQEIYYPAMYLIDSSDENAADAVIRSHIEKLKAMAERVQQEHDELSDLDRRIRPEPRAKARKALNDIKTVKLMLDGKIAWLGPFLR